MRCWRSISKGLLHGVPILLKDNIDSLDMPTTAGSLALKDNVTGRDSPLVARLRAAGAVILGKTNLSEWANFRSSSSTSGWSGVGGQTKNPHVLDRNPCGSSAGSGSAWRQAWRRRPSARRRTARSSAHRLHQRHCGHQADRRPRTAHAYRADQRDAGHGRADGADGRGCRGDLLTVIAGSDAGDPASIEADAKKSDYSKALDANALQGKRIGVARYLAGYHGPTDAAFEKRWKS
jgi:amidase